MPWDLNGLSSQNQKISPPVIDGRRLDAAGVPYTVARVGHPGRARATPASPGGGMTG